MTKIDHPHHDHTLMKYNDDKIKEKKDTVRPMRKKTGEKVKK